MDFDFDRIDRQFDPIQEANDRFRLSLMNVEDNILWAQDTIRHGIDFRTQVLVAVREEPNFGKSDTLHDYGTVVVHGKRFAWKITYHDSQGTPVDPGVECHRGLSIEPE
jgi:hypothetical protein